jgi:hypothetical protein
MEKHARARRQHLVNVASISLGQLRSGRGFAPTRDADEEHARRNPDGNEVPFWAENGHRDIVSQSED